MALAVLVVFDGAMGRFAALGMYQELRGLSWMCTYFVYPANAVACVQRSRRGALASG